MMDEFKITNNDYYYSYLPMAHMFERICFNGLMFGGGRMGIMSQTVR